MSEPLTVTQFRRRARAHGNFSVEQLFDALAERLRDRCAIRSIACPFESSGLWRRVANAAHAARQAGGVNHVTGDVHYLALGLPGRRTILTILDCGRLRELTGPRRAILEWLWFRLPARRVARVTTISAFVADELRARFGWPEGKVRAIHCPVLPVFCPVPARPWPDEPEVLLVGATPNKNLEGAARALAGLRCRVRLVGKPSPEQERALREAGLKVETAWNLSLDDMAEAYRRCDLLLFPSFYEGFGLPIVEAQATGRPVVTSHVASMPEVAGKGACLVDPGDPASIRAGVERVLVDPAYRAAMVCAGFENVRRFELGAIAAQYERLYREVAEEASCAE